MEFKLVPFIVAQIGTMRKSQHFYIMPDDEGGIIAESDNYIGKFDKFGNGLFGRKGNVKEFKFPAHFVYEAMKICPAMGTEKFFDGLIEL